MAFECRFRYQDFFCIDLPFKSISAQLSQIFFKIFRYKLLRDTVIFCNKYFLIFVVQNVLFACSSLDFFQFSLGFNKRILKQNTARFIGVVLPTYFTTIDRCNI
jgi:hypothetical protein